MEVRKKEKVNMENKKITMKSRFENGHFNLAPHAYSAAIQDLQTNAPINEKIWYVLNSLSYPILAVLFYFTSGSIWTAVLAPVLVQLISGFPTFCSVIYQSIVNVLKFSEKYTEEEFKTLTTDFDLDIVLKGSYILWSRFVKISTVITLLYLILGK